jgi:protein SCO1/2
VSGRLLRNLAIGAVLSVCAAAAGAVAPAFKAGVFDPPRPAPGFALQGTDGQALDLNGYRGKVVLLAFGYSSCTAVCPITLNTLAQARRKLGPKADAVQVVYITVDPERDTPSRLKKFLSSFDATFVGGTGSEQQLEQVRKDYGVSARKITYPDKSYSYDHSSFTYLIDRSGRIRALMPYGHSPDDFANDLTILLRE